MKKKAIFIGAGLILCLSAITARSEESNSYFSKAPDPEQIVTDPRGGVYPVNQLIVIFENNINRSDADSLAASVGGTVVGYSPLTDAYQFEVPATTIEELDKIIDKIKKNETVEGVTRNNQYSFDY